jgi:CRISPR-associated protein Cas5d
MLFDLDYDDNGKPSPLYFYDVAIIDGILNCEVSENDTLMKSSHKQPPVNSEFSAMMYEFNKHEEGGAEK